MGWLVIALIAALVWVTFGFIWAAAAVLVVLAFMTIGGDLLQALTTRNVIP